MKTKTTKILAYIVNFIIVGGGFVFYKKTVVGLGWFVIFILANFTKDFLGLEASIGLRLIVMIASYIHLYKVIEKK